MHQRTLIIPRSKKYLFLLVVLIAVYFSTFLSRGIAFWDQHGLSSGISNIYWGATRLSQGLLHVVVGPADIFGGGLKLSSNPVGAVMGMFGGSRKTLTAAPSVVVGSAQLIVGAGQIMCSMVKSDSKCFMLYGLGTAAVSYGGVQAMKSLQIPPDVQPCVNLAHEGFDWTVNATLTELSSVNVLDWLNATSSCLNPHQSCQVSFREGVIYGSGQLLNGTSYALIKGGECMVNTSNLPLSIVGYNWVGAGRMLGSLRLIFNNPYKIIDTLKGVISML